MSLSDFGIGVYCNCSISYDSVLQMFFSTPQALTKGEISGLNTERVFIVQYVNSSVLIFKPWGLNSVLKCYAIVLNHMLSACKMYLRLAASGISMALM